MDAARIVQEQVDAFNARDADRYAGYYSPDASVVDGSGNVYAEGREAIRAVFGQIFAQSPNLHVDVPNRICVPGIGAGTWVIDEEQTRGFILEGFPPDFHNAVVYRVEDGMIVKQMGLL